MPGLAGAPAKYTELIIKGRQSKYFNIKKTGGRRSDVTALGRDADGRAGHHGAAGGHLGGLQQAAEQIYLGCRPLYGCRGCCHFRAQSGKGDVFTSLAIQGELHCARDAKARKVHNW